MQEQSRKARGSKADSFLRAVTTSLTSLWSVAVVRRLDAYQHYEYEQSEKLIRQLKDQGVEVFYTHLYKGFGMAAKYPIWKPPLRTAAIAHRLG